MQIPFSGQSNAGRSINVDATRSINFFPELSVVSDAKTSLAMIGTPGVTTFADFVSGEIRLMYNFNGREFVVVDDSFYELFTDGTYTFIGSLSTLSGPLFAVDNGIASLGVGGNQLIMVTPDGGDIYNILLNTVVPITDPNFPAKPHSVTYLDGYFIVTDDTMAFQVSKLYDGMVYPGLATAAAIGTPDPIQRAVSLNQQLFLIKSRSTEVWYNNGVPTSQGSPFSRIQGAVLSFGTPAPRSVAYALDTFFFVANQGHNNTSEFVGVVMMQGNAPTIISTPAINYRMSRFSTISDSIGYCYSDEGHAFYVLTFPTEDATFVYDLSTKMWHERSTADSLDNDVHRHLSNLYSYFGNKHLVSDYRNSKIMEMSSQYYDDNGTPIVSERIFPTLFNKSELRSIFIHKLVIDIESGVGDGSLTHNGDPQAWLSWSNDGGHTWSDEYTPASMGKQGEFKKRLTWRRLGRSRERTFKVRIVDAVKKVLLAAYLNDGVEI